MFIVCFHVSLILAQTVAILYFFLDDGEVIPGEQRTGDYRAWTKQNSYWQPYVGSYQEFQPAQSGKLSHVFFHGFENIQMEK